MYSLYNYWFCYKNGKNNNNYPQVYLEECKYKMKKIRVSKFINTELEHESESESELDSDTRLESKSKLESDS